MNFKKLVEIFDFLFPFYINTLGFQKVHRKSKKNIMGSIGALTAKIGELI